MPPQYVSVINDTPHVRTMYHPHSAVDPNTEQSNTVKGIPIPLLRVRMFLRTVDEFD